ncbi:MAG: thioesterase [Chloroflexi bacterium]|nr:thioesterase [Chloroflexota bacterium]
MQTLEATLHHEIPLTRALGVTVEDYDGQVLSLKAPLEPNINHKDTAFAGSLNALVTLSGWGLVWLILKEAGIAAKIVIQDSQVNYTLPVAGDFVACCRKPDPAQLERFQAMLVKKGRARLELGAEIRVGSRAAVTFQGRYVAHLVR